jgi:stress-induced morphogen
MVMTRAQRMEAVLQAAFAPASLEIVDESAKHAGHAGARPGGETHYQVTMVADTFEGLSRVDRQRRVNEVLAAEFDGGLHALSLRLKAPSEAT